MTIQPHVGVKICGLNEAVGLSAALDHGADWVGFVLFARSPRYVTPEQAAQLIGSVKSRACTVALFVEPSDDEISALLGLARPDVLQVYASDARIADIRARFGVPVWRAAAVAEVQDLPRATDADGLLIESRAPAGSDRPGGNGLAFDWTILRGWQSPAPWLLAGGLTADTVADAVRASGAPGVDVSSGVERAPGVKSPDLIARFITAARQAVVQAH